MTGLDGIPVGLLVGLLDGLIRGIFDGLIVGRFEGSIEGDSVGFCDGSSVGLGTGAAVGNFDGRIVVGLLVDEGFRETGIFVGIPVLGAVVGLPGDFVEGIKEGFLEGTLLDSVPAFLEGVNDLFTDGSDVVGD